MSSPQLTGGHEGATPGSGGTPADSGQPFQDLLRRLGECHDHTVQGLQEKVNHLKKERYLDAQRLEEFYKRNQHLREEQRNLQDSITHLKDRLKSGPCDRCKEMEKEMKKIQTLIENQENLPLIKEIKAERDVLREENRKLALELKHLRSQQTSFVEPEEGVIPDSPLQSMSFPVVSKMKRKRDQSHVRYAEKPLSQPDLPMGELPRVSDTHSGAVLVPETCDLDGVCLRDHSNIHGRTVVAETCRLDFDAEQDSGSDGDSQTLLQPVCKKAQRVECPSVSSTGRNVSVPVPSVSPAVLRRVSPSNARLVLEEQDVMKSHKRPSSSQLRPSKGPCDGGSRVPDQGRSQSLPPKSLPPLSPRRSPPASQDCSPYDQSWSVDPGAALSQYGASSPPHSEPKVQPAGTVDMDYTFVSHSLLLRSRRQAGLDKLNSTTGIGLKANDSLANIFDTTGDGEYESCPQEQVHENKPEEEEEQEPEQDEQMEDAGLMEEDFDRPSTKAGEGPTGDVTEKSVACVEVVRKRDDRRKLQGHTCKECEIYYADLPVAERQKKLSSCSRHRYRYIPPSTPENFWEVGFPSTQTCVERGYIKEDDQADPRMRRRRPYLAKFSPKAKTPKI
ncbi:DNA endonuclease RBBP8 isoform X2 [Brachyhypopomus gauderio]|uniref:DNA endonuclease RBBP8 isoform X2 n=1 Tax=Brachyhypopomus gauderio TaxID=698409 RepID=UPI004042A4E7